MGKPQTYYKKGDWNADCDRCGFTYKASELKTEWQGLKVCSTCYEPRHPADLFRIPRSERPVPWTRPPQDIILDRTDYYIADGRYTADGETDASAGYGIADPSPKYVVFGPADPDSL